MANARCSIIERRGHTRVVDGAADDAYETDDEATFSLGMAWIVALNS